MAAQKCARQPSFGKENIYKIRETEEPLRTARFSVVHQKIMTGSEISVLWETDAGWSFYAAPFKRF